MSQVVVVGGGMAGVACALELGDKGIEVLLIDRNDYLQFQPLLYQVASSQLPAEDVARPLSAVFADHPTVTVVRSPVTAIDFGARRVTTDERHLHRRRLPRARRRCAGRTSSASPAPASIRSRCTPLPTPNDSGCTCTVCCGCTATPDAPLRTR